MTEKLWETPSLIESITNTNKPKEATNELLKRREKFWTRTLETLQPRGLSDKINLECLYPAIVLFNFKFVVSLEVQFGR